MYGGYNKPEAVREWLDHEEPNSDYVLILDTDLIVRAPFLPQQLHIRPGFARSAEFGYMKGALCMPSITAATRVNWSLTATMQFAVICCCPHPHFIAILPVEPYARVHESGIRCEGHS